MAIDTTPAAIEAKEHMSDCSVHNGPAFPEGPCDCGAGPQISNRKALRKAQLRIGRQRDELAFLKAELATARDERDEARYLFELSKLTTEAVLDRAVKAETELAALRKEVERLREAAKLVSEWEEWRAQVGGICPDRLVDCWGKLRTILIAEPLGHGVTADDFGGEA